MAVLTVLIRPWRLWDLHVFRGIGWPLLLVCWVPALLATYGTWKSLVMMLLGRETLRRAARP
jgi:hypothetical protein